MYFARSSLLHCPNIFLNISFHISAVAAKLSSTSARRSLTGQPPERNNATQRLGLSKQGIAEHGCGGAATA